MCRAEPFLGTSPCCDWFDVWLCH
ncbi:hypothetical protein Nmel_008427 [Mimus melanotis]